MNYLKTILYLLIFSLGYSINGFSQQIYLGNEISYSSNDGFFFMGEIRDTLLLFQENGNEYSIMVHNNDLEYLFTKDVFFEKQRIRFNSILTRDDDFTMIYSFEDRFNHKVMARKFDARGNLLDSVGIFQEKDYLDVEYFSTVQSEDKNKVLLFRTVRFDYLEMVLFDLERHERLWHTKKEFKDYEISNDLNGILLTNNGQVILAFEENNFAFRRNKHIQHIYVLDPENQMETDQKVSFDGNMSVSFNFVFDEKNMEIVVAGLYAEKSRSKAEGYYLYKIDGSDFSQPLVFNTFPHRLLMEYIGGRKSPKKYIPDLSVTDIMLRNDGGLVMITEMQKEILRESVRRRYIDYHYEDIILLSIHPEGDLFWHELIRKYQMSYDDNARYSSYFLFETPSSLKIIFNDEIKSENTISEYTINPLGNGKRTALFSTDLHRLKLVFDTAIQISSSTFVVPSMYNSKYRLIMIKY